MKLAPLASDPTECVSALVFAICRPIWHCVDCEREHDEETSRLLHGEPTKVERPNNERNGP